MTDPTFAALTAIRHWPDKAALARLAKERHGFADSNAGFGIVYPGDVDDVDRDLDGREIPNGFVLAYGFWGPPDGYEVFVPEWLYRDVLAEVLECLGMSREAAGIHQRRRLKPRAKAGAIFRQPLGIFGKRGRDFDIGIGIGRDQLRAARMG